MVLLVLGLELLEEVDQRLSALNGHGVVNARAQTADGLVALEVIVARSLGGGDDFGIQLGGVGDEGDVHERAELRLDRAVEHLGGIQEVIDDLGLGDVALVHLLETADALEILEDLAAAVDRPAVGGIVHGAVLGVGVIAHIDRHLGIEVFADEVLADDDDDHAGRADVLLHARVDHVVVADVAGLGEEHGALVGDEDVALGVGQLLPGHTVDGLVLADVDVVGVVGNVEIGAVGNVAVVLILGGSGNDDLAVLLGFLDGLAGPCAGVDVDGLAVLHQVPGNRRELEGGAALNEEDLIVVGDPHQVAQVGVGLVDDLLEDLGAVGHLHDAHAAAAVVHHLVTDLLQHGLGHHGGTGGEVVGAIVLHCCFLLIVVILR